MYNLYCVCINCSPIFTGMVKNLMEKQGFLQVKSIKTDQINTFFSPTNRSSSGLADPDFIFLHVDEDYDGAAQTINLLYKNHSFSDVPIILVTGHGSINNTKKLMALGVKEIIVFPRDAEKIFTVIQRALKPVGKNMPIDTKIINPFIQATIDLMSTMAGLQVERKALYLKRNYKLFGEISGIMNFSGNIQGSVVVCFSNDLAKEIVARIMNCSIDQLSSLELKEGVGEIVNIISGNAKVALAETEYSHQITLPSVISGFGHEISHPPDAPCIVIIFEANQKTFAVQVSMVVN